MIKNLQALRAVAAILVVGAHLNYLFETLHVHFAGASGVDLFFVISGFVMVHTTRVHPPTSAKFIKNRIARIVPIYWLMTAAVFLIAVFAPSFVKATRADPMELLKSLLFIPFRKSNGIPQPVLFVGWSLNYEMFFYFLFSIGLLLRNYTLGLIAIFLCLIGLVLLGATLHPHGVITSFYTDLRMLEFALGMAVALITPRAPVSVPLRAKYLASALILSLVIIVMAPYYRPDLNILITAGFPSAILVTAAVLLERWEWKLENSYVIAIGDSSYALYLSHPYVVLPIQKLAAPFHPTGIFALALVCSALAMAIMVGYAIHVYIERPISKFARTILSANKLQAQPA
jgi:exopolysaccharide production protein ExoZ